MKKIFIDTNILIDVFTQRENFILILQEFYH